MFRDQNVNEGLGGESHASPWVASYARPYHPDLAGVCPFHPSPTASGHHLPTDCGPCLDMEDFMSEVPPQKFPHSFSPLSRFLLPLAMALGFYLEFPSYHAPTFFLMYLFCYGGGEYQMNKIAFK